MGYDGGGIIMPTNVVKTQRDEKFWNAAKWAAKKAGKEDNWAYVMGVFQKMRGKKKEG